MCGIAGIINFKGGLSNPNLIKKMTETIAHRGPDDSGYFQDTNVAFGFIFFTRETTSLTISSLKDGSPP